METVIIASIKKIKLLCVNITLFFGEKNVKAFLFKLFSQ